MRKAGVTGVILVAILLVCSSLAMGYWKVKVTGNQIKAKAYIEQLMNGVDPDSLERPPIRYDTKYEAKVANREIRQAMDRAEQLAREGKQDQIVMPEFKQFMSEERYYELEQNTEERYYEVEGSSTSYQSEKY